MRIIIWRYGYVTSVHTSLVNSTRYKIDPIQYTHPGLLFSVTMHMQYYSMVRYFTHHSSLKGVKIQSLNLLYIVCLPNNIHHRDHFDTHIVKGLAR